ncbi:protein kintoun-like [Mercenaria mercenaria]|uniref:protein kintoun-like n=1 Tax=Mercenaria mercenaria TaxID=6596 RepID=UPI00234EB2E3|nr:protein kintoun-like [Mercenaria mercenaria]
MASSKTFEDLDLSREEIKRIETALKDEKFRKMFIEYAEEISNPENRRIYEEEIAMLENERGMDVQFVNPEPGHVLKTTVSGGKKAFINICTSDKIGKPTSKKQKNEEGKRGLHWQIPHSFAPPREDFDKAKQTCMVYDVVFHPDTYRMTSNLNFLKLVEDTAIEGIERQFDVKLDRNNIRRPKIKCKGKPVATVIRNRKEDAVKTKSKKDETNPFSSMPYPYSDKTSSELAEEKNKQAEQRATKKASKESKTKSNNLIKEENGYTTPNYTITHRSNMDLQEFRNAPDARPTTRPKELVINIELPMCKSAAGVDLDIFEDKLSLKSENPAYKLDFKLPYPVDDENGSARFDKSKKSLVVTLPVLPGEIPQLPSFLDNVEEPNIPSLIEELPPLEEVNNFDKQVPGDLPPLEEINTTAPEESENISALSPTESVNKTSVLYSLPEYDFNQDQETVTFVFHVRNVNDDSVCKSFPHPGSCEIKFVSVGSGGFPMHYRFYGCFGEVCKLVPEHCTVDISDRNMTFTLLKQRDCRTLWNKFFAGVDEDNLEEKLFVTSDNLQEELDKLQLEGEKMGRTDEHAPEAHSANIKVVEMNEKKLTLNIRKPSTSFSEEEENGYDGEESPLSASIEVVHSQKLPNLHGILKQRSVSESSEDHLSLSSGDSPTSCSPRDSDGSTGRRSVSFNSHIDKTTYKTNATVTSMKQALKSKRKRNRKREEKKKEKDGRRRHNSNGSECSSCDEHDSRHSSESHSEDDPEAEDLAQQLEETGKKVEDCGVIVEDQEEFDDKVEKETEENKPDESDNSKKPGYQIHSEADKKSSKLAAEVKSKMEEMKDDSRENDSDDDIGDENVERTSVNGQKKNVITRDENQQKNVNLTSGKSESQESKVSDLSVAENGKNPSVAANQDSGEVNLNGDMDSAIKGNNPGKGSQKGVKFKDDVKEKLEGKGDGAEKVEEESIVETELTWHDTKRLDPFNEHRTQCAFNFSNNVMFDLDID